MFCAAIPATLAVGANLSAKELKEKRLAEERGEIPSKKMKVSKGKIAIVAAGALMAASVVYHSQFSG
jgi:hypothetical protein